MAKLWKKIFSREDSASETPPQEGTIREEEIKPGEVPPEVEEPPVAGQDKVDEQPALQENGEGIPYPAALSADQFIDFDEWITVLEFHFGPDFEKVLSNELGPDWVSKINEMMSARKNFFEVVQNVKKEVLGQADEEEDFSKANISFEPVNDETGGPGFGGGGGRGGRGGGGGGAGGAGGGGEGGGSDSIPLADLKRKEFVAADKFKLDTHPEEYEYERVLRFKGEKKEGEKEGRAAGESDEVVLMDRRDFEKLSYYAHKEKERIHEEEPPPKTVKSEIPPLLEQGAAGRLTRVVAAVTAVFFIYVFLNVIIFFACNIYSRSLLDTLPPDLVFQPSTPLHKQGVLARFSAQDRKQGQPLIVYWLRSSLNRIDLNYVGLARSEQYRLAECGPSLIVVLRGQGDDSLTVRKHSPDYLPTNLDAFLDRPLLSLSVGRSTALQAFETPMSSILPGLTRMGISDGQGTVIGQAYVADEQVNILLNGWSSYSQDRQRVIEEYLVFLFSIMRL